MSRKLVGLFVLIWLVFVLPTTAVIVVPLLLVQLRLL
jgi:hypothetical protein